MANHELIVAGYLVGFVITASLIGRRGARRGYPLGAVIALAVFGGGFWPIFWLLTIYGELKIRFGSGLET